MGKKERIAFFPTLGVGLSDFKLNSSPRPELFSSPGLLIAHPWSAQPPSVPGMPNSRMFLECPSAVPNTIFWSPECPAPELCWSAGVSLECPTPEYLYQARVGSKYNNYCFCLLATFPAGQGGPQCSTETRTSLRSSEPINIGCAAEWERQEAGCSALRCAARRCAALRCTALRRRR